MNRRNFLQSAAAAVAALAVDPERLLWTPGKKAFFIPKPELFIRPDAMEFYRRVALEQLKNNFAFSGFAADYCRNHHGDGVCGAHAIGGAWEQDLSDSVDLVITERSGRTINTKQIKIGELFDVTPFRYRAEYEP